MSYSAEIWYAEHATEGDKFYKVITIRADAFAGQEFCVTQYGPRSVHVSLDSVTTGQTAVDDGLKPGNGASNRSRKTKGGYTRNEQTAKRSFATRDLLLSWVRSNFGPKVKNTAMKNVALLTDLASSMGAPSAPAFQPDDTPSTLHEHQDFGAW